MDNKFQDLPPLKRYRLLQQQQQVLAQESLPAKKRKKSLNPITPTYCLPAKKRIWAFHPFDLNLEYNPSLEQDEKSQLNYPPNTTTQISETEAEGDEEEEEEEDGIVCAVCQSTDGDPLDPIVFCDGCDLMVHTTCYGAPLTNGVPDGDWFCSQCLVSKTKKKCPISCCLCPENGGALKPTVDGKWAHIVCALFVPEVFFKDSQGREGIDYSNVPSRRWSQSCYICESKNGCAIDCSEPKCPLAFHVTCGLKQEVCIEYREGRKNGAIVAGFCKTHTDLWNKQQQSGKFKIVARDEQKKNYSTL